MSPLLIRTIRGMVWDTFRQSLASKLFWGMLTLTIIAVALCLSLDVHGDMAPSLPYDTTGFLPAKDPERHKDTVPVISGEVSLGFGLVTIPLGRHRESAVRFVQLWLAGAVAGAVGVLLALLWTAGFLPSFLEPQAATVLLVKPVPRWVILLGKYLGVTLFVAVQAAFFIGGTWLALGLKTGVWNASYWLAVPLLILNFAIFYSISVFLAVWTRSTVASLFGTLLVWLLCWAINFGYAQSSLRPVPGAVGGKLLTAAYWVLPKPVDLGGVFYDALRADAYSLNVPELEFARAAGTIHPEMSVLTSCVFAVLVLLAAAYEFHHTDY